MTENVAYCAYCDGYIDPEETTISVRNLIWHADCYEKDPDVFGKRVNINIGKTLS